MRRIIIFLFVLLMLCPISAWAAPEDDPDCNQFTALSDAGKFISFSVKCSEKLVLRFFGFKKVGGSLQPAVLAGGEPNVVANLILATKNAVLMVLVMALVFLGIKMIKGGVEKVGPELIGVAVKIAAVIFFIETGMMMIYPALIGFADEFGGMLSYNISYPGCNVAGIDVWEKSDCIVNGLFGGILSTDNILIMILAIMLTKVGVFVVVLIVALILMIVSAFATVAFTYIMCFIAITFLTMLSPLIIPLVLFQYTKNIYKNWFDLLVSYTLQPVIVLGYLALMLAVLSKVFDGGAVPQEGVEFQLGNALLNIEQKTIFCVSVFNEFCLKLPGMKAAWINNEMYRFVAVMISAALTVILLYTFLINVVNFANELIGLKAGSVNFGAKFNLVNMTMKAASAAINPLSKTGTFMRAKGIPSVARAAFKKRK